MVRSSSTLSRGDGDRGETEALSGLRTQSRTAPPGGASFYARLAGGGGNSKVSRLLCPSSVNGGVRIATIFLWSKTLWVRSSLLTPSWPFNSVLVSGGGLHHVSPGVSAARGATPCPLALQPPRRLTPAVTGLQTPKRPPPHQPEKKTTVAAPARKEVRSKTTDA